MTNLTEEAIQNWNSYNELKTNYDELQNQYQVKVDEINQLHEKLKDSDKKYNKLLNDQLREERQFQDEIYLLTKENKQLQQEVKILKNENKNAIKHKRA